MIGTQQILFNYQNKLSDSSRNFISVDVIEQLNDIIMAQYDMSVYERRIFAKLIEQVPETLSMVGEKAVLEDIIVDARDIIQSNGLRGESAYMELQKATANLIKHVCRIAENDGLLQVSLLSSAKYLKGRGLIRLRFDVALYPYFIKLKNQFNSYQLEKLLHFRSYYSQCMYELLKKSYVAGGSFYISIEQLRNILKIETTEYKRYFDLKRYVIQQAQKELKDSEMVFHFIEKKQGKSVVALQIFFLK